MTAPWLLWFVLQSGLPEADPRALREEARTVRLELEAAQSGEFYLIVNLARSAMALKLRGVTLESLPFGSIDLARRFGSDSTDATRLAPLFACHAPEAPPPPEIRPGEVAPVETPPAPPLRSLSLECDPSLEIRFVPAAAHGLFTALKNRFGRSSEISTRVVVVLGDEEAARLAAVLPETLRLLFSWAEAP